MLNLEKKARSGDKEIKKQLEVVKKIASKLEEGTQFESTRIGMLKMKNY